MKTEDQVRQEFETAVKAEFPTKDFSRTSSSYDDDELNPAWWAWAYQESRFNAEIISNHNALNAATIIADHAYSVFEFGDGVKVVGDDGWDTSELNNLIKIVYVNFDDDAPEADSTKVSFHVRFDESGELSEVYALEHRHGAEIGRMPKTESAKNKP